MTFGAIVSKLAVVDIAMAGGAAAKLNAHKFGEEQLVDSLNVIFWSRLVAVAFLAFHSLMFAGQSKLRLIVGKLLRRLPARIGVTFQAVRCKLTAMLIVMATQTLRVQTQKGFTEIDFRVELSRIVYNFCRLVAALAFLLRVFAFQAIAGLAMIKILFAAGPEDHVETLTVMFAVTFKTGFAVSAGYPEMVSPLIGQPLGNFTMAIQAFLHVRAAPESMAFGAIAHSFQVGMGLCQFARRNLRSQR